MKIIRFIAKKNHKIVAINLYMAGETGLEPATPGFGDQYSAN